MKDSSNKSSESRNDRKLPASKPMFDALENGYNESISTVNSLDQNREARTFTVPDDDTSVDRLGESDQEDESGDEFSRESEGDDPRSSEGPDDDSVLDTLPPPSRQMDPTPMKPRMNGYNGASSGIDWANSDFMSSGVGTSPKSTKRLRNSLVTFDASIHETSPAKRRKKESALPAIVDRMSRRLGVAALVESDELILDTESSINRLYETAQLSEDPERALEVALPSATTDVCKLWRRLADQDAQGVPIEDEVILGIGPSEDSTPFQKAAFIAPLILELHHPSAATGKQASASSSVFRPSQSTSLPNPAGPPTRLAPVPKVLGDWLEYHHNPYASSTADLQMHLPNPTAHVNYWDILLNMLLRGNIFDVIRTLKRSNFKHARTARQEGMNGQNNYDESVCRNIATVVDRAAEVFQECPILVDEDWDVSGIRWGVFRNQLERANDDLKEFAEGSDQDGKTLGSEFNAPSFGLRGTASNFGSRKSDRPLPSVVYENLKTMYGILLGKTPEIVSSAQNWVEATLGLTIWWDGEDDDEEIAVGSLTQSRRSLRRSQIRGNRTVDINPVAAYLRRLSSAFEKVTDDDDPELFQVNSNNMVEVGLATVFESNVEGVISLLRGWSLPIASAVAAIANIGGWFEPSVGAETMPDFDESDLMVLSYTQKEQGLTMDGILVDYAEKLSKRDKLHSTTTRERREGWEVSMQVLIRLNEEDTAMKNLRELIQRLPLTSDSRVDRVLQACHGFGLDQEASGIAEVCYFDPRKKKPVILTQKSATQTPSPATQSSTVLLSSIMLAQGDRRRLGMSWTC